MADQFRLFENEIGVIAGVTAQFDPKGKNKGKDFQPAIEPNGRIVLKSEFSYGGLKDRNQVRERAPVTAFTLQVLKHKDADNVFVLQREDAGPYFERGSSPFGDDLLQHSFPPCVIQTRPRSEEERKKIGINNPLAVWCPGNQGRGTASNRADVFRIGDGEEGNRVELLTLFVVTFDDGKTFRLVGEYGWQGTVYRRQHPAAYQLKTDDEKAINAFYGSPVMQDFLRDYVLVPDEGYGSFELKIQALMVHKLRQKLMAAGDEAGVWDGSEDFWVKEPPLKVELHDDQAMVQFHRYGMAEASFGIIKLPKPIKVGGRDVQEAQIRHTSFVECEEDDQGLVIAKPGDIVRHERLIPMDRDGKKFPPLAIGVGVLYRYFDPA